MSLEEIVMEILRTTAVKTLAQLTRLVVAHSEYRGKSKGQALQNRIKRILQDEQFQQEIQKSGSYIELKLGRFKGTLDLF
ncbi:hypothetical protein ACFLWS_02795 [Chloroflexota bacterium]